MNLISGQAGESAIVFGKVGVVMWEWPSGCDPQVGVSKEGVNTQVWTSGCGGCSQVGVATWVGLSGCGHVAVAKQMPSPKLAHERQPQAPHRRSRKLNSRTRREWNSRSEIEWVVATTAEKCLQQCATVRTLPCTVELCVYV
jgi:hypothetical protein